MRLANNNGLTMKNSQVNWVRQDLVAEAVHIASDLINIKHQRYDESFKDFAPLRMRIPARSRSFIGRFRKVSRRKAAEIREDLACEIEARLGENSEVSIGLWWITAGKF